MRTKTGQPKLGVCISDDWEVGAFRIKDADTSTLVRTLFLTQQMASVHLRESIYSQGSNPILRALLT